MWKFFSSKILNGQSRTVTAAAMILALASLASRLLGLARDRILAGTFGAGDTLDIYYAAFRAPDLVYNLLITGALSAGFIPVFVSLWGGAQEKDGAWRFANSVLNTLAAGLIILGGLFFAAAPWLMEIITPGFAGEKFELAVALTRIMFLSPLLLGLSAVFGGVLQSAKRFLIFSLTPIFYNLGIIAGILWFYPLWGIYGLAWGVILGALLHLAVQLPSIFSLGFKYQLVFDWANDGVRRLARLMVPRTLTLAVSQATFIALTALASSLAAGSLAIFNLAYNIWTFPLGILAASVATAAFPSLSERAAAADKAGFAEVFSSSFRQILFLVMPAGFLFWVLGDSIVRIILATGQFGPAATLLAVETLRFLVWGLLAEALSLLLVRGFFAWEDTRTPFWLALLTFFLRFAAAWYFSGTLGAAGLGLGLALGSAANALLLWAFLMKKLGRLQFGAILASGVRIWLASLAAGGAAWWLLGMTGRFFNVETFGGLLAQGAAAGGAGLAVYFLAAALLGVSELRGWWQGLKSRAPIDKTAEKEMIEN